MISEFTQFGTNIITITPGKIRTHGRSLGAIGSARLLTIEDALALKDSRYVQHVNAGVMGNAEIRAGGRSRRVTVYGESPDFAHTFNMKVASGRFLPEDDPRNPRAYVVLGSKVRTELFGSANPLGATLQVGLSRFRVIGVMESKGQVLGLDLDDTVSSSDHARAGNFQSRRRNGHSMLLISRAHHCKPWWRIHGASLSSARAGRFYNHAPTANA